MVHKYSPLKTMRSVSLRWEKNLVVYRYWFNRWVGLPRMDAPIFQSLGHDIHVYGRVGILS